jgi:secreted trypsin-like serine protease
MDPATEFAAGAPFLDRDSCNGDSGGPAYVQVDGEWHLAGATSRATASSLRPCGDGGIYTRIDAYEEWIRSVPGGVWD